jgi:hypothetical protein
MKDESGVEHFELNEAEKKLVLAALQRMLVRGRYRQVDGAKLVDFQKLVAKFSNKDLVRVSRKYVLIEKEAPKSRPPEEW